MSANARFTQYAGTATERSESWLRLLVEGKEKRTRWLQLTEMFKMRKDNLCEIPVTSFCATGNDLF